MQYSQINSDAPNAVSSSPMSSPSSRTYSLKHVLGGALCAAMLTAVTLHAVVYRPVAYHPAMPTMPAMPAVPAMPMMSRGFRPNNSCGDFLGRGMCAAVLTEGHSFQYRQCSNDLGGAKPTTCECGGFALPKSGGDKPYVLRHEMRGPACVCEFHTGTPGKSVWTMKLNCA